MIEKQREVSLAEFVVWELQQTGRHELIGGRGVPFLAGLVDHETIAVNVIANSLQSPDHRAKFLAAPPSFKHFHAFGEDGRAL